MLGGDAGGEGGMMGMGGVSGMGTWNEVWRCEVAIPVVHLKFSPDSTLFATAGEVSMYMYGGSYLLSLIIFIIMHVIFAYLWLGSKKYVTLSR